jgi:DNA-binding NtrC family response regulator
MTKILVVDDEPQIRRILTVMLSENGYEVAEAQSGEQALVIEKDFRANLVLLDVSMPGMDGLTTLGALLEQDKTIDCIMMTAYGTIRSAVEAMRLGAYDYLTKPFDNNELLMIVRRVEQFRLLVDEVEDLRIELSSRYGFSEIIGISPGLQAIFSTIVKVAPVDATVLIEGASGTGKELVARAIYRRSKRSEGPFVAVNCGAIPESLFEAEFFGYERGAFTDAKEARAGRFERAQGGVLFLDEVGELRLDSQVKILRALQNREIIRLGGQTATKLDVRIIAATNVDLKAAVEQGRFREDLYWRLNVVKLSIPALRDRREDIPLLIDHLLERFRKETGLEVKAVAADARQLLQMYEWQGNVRELENVICSAMIMCDGRIITARDLPPRIRGEIEGEPSAGADATSTDIANLSLAEAVRHATEKLEKVMIVSRLSAMDGNRTATAESLGISRKTLFNKMRQYRLEDGTEMPS